MSIVAPISPSVSHQCAATNDASLLLIDESSHAAIANFWRYCSSLPVHSCSLDNYLTPKALHFSNNFEVVNNLSILKVYSFQVNVMLTDKCLGLEPLKKQLALTYSVSRLGKMLK